MTFDEVAAKVKKVRFTGPGKATGLCPAHLDKKPSLGIRAGEDRLLLHCFAGCSIQDICFALSMELHDLFYEQKACKPRGTHRHKSAISHNSVYQTSKMLRDYANKFLSLAQGQHFHSTRVLERARGVSIDDWTPGQLDRALGIVDKALQKQRLVSAIDDLAGTLTTWAIDLEKKHDESRPRRAN